MAAGKSRTRETKEDGTVSRREECTSTTPPLAEKEDARDGLDEPVEGGGDQVGGETKTAC